MSSDRSCCNDGDDSVDDDDDDDEESDNGLRQHTIIDKHLKTSIVEDYYNTKHGDERPNLTFSSTSLVHSNQLTCTWWSRVMLIPKLNAATKIKKWTETFKTGYKFNGLNAKNNMASFKHFSHRNVQNYFCTVSIAIKSNQINQFKICLTINKFGHSLVSWFDFSVHSITIFRFPFYMRLTFCSRYDPYHYR